MILSVVPPTLGGVVGWRGRDFPDRGFHRKSPGGGEFFIIKCGDFLMMLSKKFWESMMLILAYDAYFFKKTQVMLVKKAQKDSQALSIMMLIK